MAYTPQWDHVRNQFTPIAEAVKAAFPAAWQSSGHTTEYVERVVDACRTQLTQPFTHQGVTKPLGQFFFCNGKRGNRRDISRDIVAFPNPTGAASPDGGGVELHDFIVAHDSPQAHIGWGDVTQDTINGAAQAGIATPAVLVVPRNFDGTVPVDPGTPTPTGPICPDPSAHVPKPPKPYPGDRHWDPIGAQLLADMQRAGQDRLNPQSGTWWGRTIWRVVNEGMTLEASIAQSRVEWCQVLGIPVI